MAVFELVAIAVVAGLSAYLGTYLREKGRNLATKEDVDKITRATEEIKAQISSQQWVKQRRRELQLDVVKDLNKLLAEFLIASIADPEFGPDPDFYVRLAATTAMVKVLFSVDGFGTFKEVEVFIGPRMGGRPVHEFVERRDAAIRALVDEIVAG